MRELNPGAKGIHQVVNNHGFTQDEGDDAHKAGNDTTLVCCGQIRKHLAKILTAENGPQCECEYCGEKQSVQNIFPIDFLHGLSSFLLFSST